MSRLALLVGALVGLGGDALRVESLRDRARSCRAVSTARNSTEVSPDVIDAMKKIYTLQFVGLSDSGIGPRDPFDPHSNRCLSSLGPSDVGKYGGVGLGFVPCPHVTLVRNASGRVVSTDEKVPEWEQLFQLDDDGSLYHCGTGLCVRLSECNDVPVYDLGHCDTAVKAHFDVWRAWANRADHVVPQGPAVKGAVGPCRACGPLLMQQVCDGPCGVVGRPPVGWTRNSSHAYEGERLAQVVLQPMPGPAMCGTSVAPLGEKYWWENATASAPEGASWWYFNKYGDHPGYAS